MSLYLALDTATDAPSLALGSPESPGDDRRLPSRRELSREIELLVRRMLAERGTAASALAGVVVGDGPGSFTGLRIGVAFAKGFCRAAALPLLAGPSLMGAALAACGGEGAVVAEYDALRGDVYRAVYRFTPGASPGGAAAAGRVEVVAPPALVAREQPADAGLVRAGAAHASAASLLRLLGFAGALERVAAPDRWEPVYGRLAEAEVRRRALEP